jgi:hypothetical protein
MLRWVGRHGPVCIAALEAEIEQVERDEEVLILRSPAGRPRRD